MEGQTAKSPCRPRGSPCAQTFTTLSDGAGVLSRAGRPDHAES